jgi:hypothetical protein
MADSLFVGPKEFIAKGKFGKGKTLVAAIAKGTIDTLSTQPANCLISVSNKGAPDLFEDLPSEFNGSDQDGDQIWIESLKTSMTRKDYKEKRINYYGPASLVVKGDLKRFHPKSGRTEINLFIPYTPIALIPFRFETHQDGTLTKKELANEILHFNYDDFEIELKQKYVFMEDTTDNNKKLDQIERCHLAIHYTYPSDFSLTDALEIVRNRLDNIFWLLSFLGRKRIDWYSCEIIYLPEKGAKGKIRYLIGNRYPSSDFKFALNKSKSWLDLLVKRSGLINNGLQNLIDNFEHHQNKQGILRSIKNLVISYEEEGYLESLMGNAYAALECLVNSFDNPNSYKGRVIDQQRFKLLRTKISDLINSEVDDPNVANELSIRIPEINNRGRKKSFDNRLFDLLKKINLPIDKIFPPGVDITEKLLELNKRRQFFIHEAKMNAQYFIDYDRYRAISELWILKLLNYPEDQINFDAISQRYLLREI